MAQEKTKFGNEPLWYKDAVIYQVHVKAFQDGNGDGIGDFQGLTQKLDYLKDLGVTAIWLLPFYPSPQKDDGYDISDYYNIHPDYGTIKNFKEFLKEAHLRGLFVITELVINHTSDKHPWFQRARKEPPGSKWRNFYVWSDTTDKYKDARIIFKDFEPSNWSWDQVAKAHYWHRFYSHQPDLNFESRDVQKEIFKVAEFWFNLGVDGMRLDAIPYLFEKEGTNCENLPETYEFLKKLRAHIDQKFKGKMFLAEANQWPEDAVKYFGEGDECQMAFHFPLMPRMYMALQMEDRFPIVDILEQTPPIPDSCQWAIFLRNHDELTLEMVTDEERDYMYRVYTKDSRAKINLGIRRRLVPLLNNDRKKIELLNILLFSILGTPIIYYGDEIGMGDNYFLGDRNGVRTPMQWSSDKNAGFSKVNPQQLYLPIIIDPSYHYEFINVENQENNLSSLLWWNRRVIEMRKKFKAFSRGSLKFLLPDNPKVLVFIREYQEEAILVVINLSRYTQYVELDLKDYYGLIPKEVFSQNDFPPIKKGEYRLMVGPHGHYWFQLCKRKKKLALREEKKFPALNVNNDWHEIFEGRLLEKLENDILPSYMLHCRWFGGKSRTIKNITIEDELILTKDLKCTRILIVQVRYKEGLDSLYLLPMGYFVEKSSQMIEDYPDGVIAHLNVKGQKGILFDAAYDKDFQNELLSFMVNKKSQKEKMGSLTGYPSNGLKKDVNGLKKPLEPLCVKKEQSNTSILYGDKFILKLYRRLETGINPDAEITRYLTEKKKFKNVPSYAGSITYDRKNKGRLDLCLLQQLVANQGDAWNFTLDELRGFYDRLLAKEEIAQADTLRPDSTPGHYSQHSSVIIEENVGGFYMEIIKLLGQRTGEMHLSLASDFDDNDFSPEPFSTHYQRSVYQSMAGLTHKVWDLLDKNFKKLPKDTQAEVKTIITAESEVLNYLKRITGKKFSAMKTRIHGDYHLGQVLFTGKDFMIIDFEGEPARSISERRLKKSALADVAGMVRSFHYASYAALYLNTNLRPDDIKKVEPWAEIWYRTISEVFLQSYFYSVKHAKLVPQEKNELDLLFQIFMMEKAVYELGYELNNRPDWIKIPVRGVQNVLNCGKQANAKVEAVKSDRLTKQLAKETS